ATFTTIGTDSATYVVQETDEGAKIRVVATTTDPDNTTTATATSTATAAVTEIAPTLTTPVIGGTAKEGQTPTATPGVANAGDAPVPYQWPADHGSGFVPIAGAPGLSYMLTEADEGATLQIVATSTDPEGIVRTATSTAPASVLDNSSLS